MAKSICILLIKQEISQLFANKSYRATRECVYMCVYVSIGIGVCVCGLLFPQVVWHLPHALFSVASLSSQIPPSIYCHSKLLFPIT